MALGRGLGAIQEAMTKGTVNLKIKNGESAVIRLLTPTDEIISVWEHTEQIDGQWQTATCLGKGVCPFCKAGKKASFKSYLVVADRTDGDKVKLFKASKKVGAQLLGLVEEYGDITKRDFKMFRQGDKLETTYQFFPRDPVAFKVDAELPDVEAMVQPKSVEELKALLGGSGTTPASVESGEMSQADMEKIDAQDNDEDFPF